MSELLAETVAAIEENEHGVEDVVWVEWHDKRAWPKIESFSCTWAEFATIAAERYDSGYGLAEIDEGLKVVGKDWWLERHEYDGSEWWEYKTMPVQPPNHRAPEEWNCLKNYQH